MSAIDPTIPQTADPEILHDPSRTVDDIEEHLRQARSLARALWELLRGNCIAIEDVRKAMRS